MPHPTKILLAPQQHLEPVITRKQRAASRQHLIATLPEVSGHFWGPTSTLASVLRP